MTTHGLLPITVARTVPINRNDIMSYAEQPVNDALTQVLDDLRTECLAKFPDSPMPTQIDIRIHEAAHLFDRNEVAIVASCKLWLELDEEDDGS